MAALIHPAMDYENWHMKDYLDENSDTVCSQYQQTMYSHRVLLQTHSVNFSAVFWWPAEFFTGEYLVPFTRDNDIT